MIVRIEEMSWVAYERRVRADRPVVLLPVGALEQHGPHLPMNCDEVIPRALSEAVAHRTGSLVAPSICYGYKSQPRSGGGNHFCGTTSLDGVTVIHTVRDIVKEFARHGVRRMVLMDGHYENTMFIVEGIDLALRDLALAGLKDMKILKIGYYEFTSRETESEVWPDGFPGWPLEHAGVMETSVMLHVRPDLVDMDQVPTHGPAEFPPYDVYPAAPENLPGLPRSGALVSARSATADKGKLLFEEYIEGIAGTMGEEFKLPRRPG